MHLNGFTVLAINSSVLTIDHMCNMAVKNGTLIQAGYLLLKRVKCVSLFIVAIVLSLGTLFMGYYELSVHRTNSARTNLVVHLHKNTLQELNLTTGCEFSAQHAPSLEKYSFNPSHLGESLGSNTIVKVTHKTREPVTSTTKGGGLHIHTHKGAARDSTKGNGQRVTIRSTPLTEAGDFVVSTGSISRALKNVEKCMCQSNFTSPDLLHVAKQNAELFIREYQTVISPDYLDGYVNYCWNINYTVSVYGNFTEGKIGRRKFKTPISTFWFGQKTKHALQHLYRGSYHTKTLCLPNIYLIGFEKCGSTHLWCLLSYVFSSRWVKTEIQTDKEPYFWAPFDYSLSPPNSGKLAGAYLPIFMGASSGELAEQIMKKLVVIDGSPNVVLEWPRFTEKEPELANYCLLPSTLPVLFPQSKYIVIMRNPVKMLYSAFWWSLHNEPGSDDLSQQVSKKLSKGPGVFHIRIRQKITQFLECVNNHPSVGTEPKCDLLRMSKESFSQCIRTRVHLLPACIADITTQREYLEAVLHRGIYYVHVRKWLETVPRGRIFFTTIENLASGTYTVMRDLYTFIKQEPMLPGLSSIRIMKNTCTENNNFINYTTPTRAIQSKTKAMLEKFFEPFNRLLSNLLQDKQFLWQS